MVGFGLNYAFGRYVVGYVGYVYSYLIVPVCQDLKGERVVEILRGIWIYGEGHGAAEVAPAGHFRFRYTGF